VVGFGLLVQPPPLLLPDIRKQKINNPTIISMTSPHLGFGFDIDLVFFRGFFMIARVLCVGGLVCGCFPSHNKDSSGSSFNEEHTIQPMTTPTNISIILPPQTSGYLFHPNSLLINFLILILSSSAMANQQSKQYL